MFGQSSSKKKKRSNDDVTESDDEQQQKSQVRVRFGQAASATTDLSASNTMRTPKKRALRGGNKHKINIDFIHKKKKLLKDICQSTNEELLYILEQQRQRNGDNIDDANIDENCLTNNSVAINMEAIAEIRRVMSQACELYGRKPGDVISMGQDDAFQLGQTDFMLPEDDDNDNANNNDDSDDDDMVDAGKCSQYPPTVIKDLSKYYIQVAAGGLHSVALSEDGNVFTWGCCDDGSLGRLPNELVKRITAEPLNDSNSNSGHRYLESYTDYEQVSPCIIRGFTPSKLSLSQELSSLFGSSNSNSTTAPSDDGEIVSIAAGDTHTLYLSLSGNVYMTGMYKDTDSGKFADLRPEDDTTKDPIPAPDDDDDDDDEKKENKPLPPPPHPTEIPRYTPVHCWQLPKKVKMIACGQSFNAALLKDDTVVTWGMGLSGELARSADMSAPTKEVDEEAKKNNDNKTPPTQYDLGMNYYKNPKGKQRFKYDVIENELLTPKPVVWHNNDKSKNSSIGFSFGSPTSALILQPKRVVTTIACGGFHLLVAAQTASSGGNSADTSHLNQLYTSGLNNYGQLGHGDTYNRHELTLVEHIKHVNILKLAAGEHHSLALNITGTEVYAFGRSDYGQSGLYDDQQGAGSFVPKPQQVAFPKEKNKSNEVVRVIDIDAGDRHSTIITSNNDVYSWGFGETGSTGHVSAGNDGSDNDTNRPKKVELNKMFPSSHFVIGDKRKKANKQDDNYRNVKVSNVSGGGQHSLMIIQRYS